MHLHSVPFVPRQTGEVTDAHAIVAGAPVRDECTQDWNLLSSDVGSGGLVFEAERALDTGDAQDRALVDDTEDGNHLINCFIVIFELHKYGR